MKITVTFSFVFLALLSLSCKKQYNCDCIETIDGVETNNNGKHVGWRDASESDAQWQCGTYETSHTVNGSVVEYECTLTSE